MRIFFCLYLHFQAFIFLGESRAVGPIMDKDLKMQLKQGKGTAVHFMTLGNWFMTPLLFRLIEAVKSWVKVSLPMKQDVSCRSKNFMTPFRHE